MNTFYAPILREQFNQLYRFGYTTLPESILVEADSSELPTQTDCQRVAEKLTELSPFEYEEEYIVLQFRCSPTGKDELINLGIRDVQRVFPLNERSKEFFKDHLDKRIQFQPPVFESFIVNQRERIRWRDAERAVEGLWTHFGFIDAIQEVWELIPKEEIQAGLQARIDGTKAHALKDAPYWAYVIAYDRYEAYPAHTLGYFYDAGQLYANMRGLPTFEGSGLYKVLEGIFQAGGKALFPKVKMALERGLSANKYLDGTTFHGPQEQKLRAYLITPIFLLIKDQLRESEDLTKTVLFKDVTFLKEKLDDAEFKVLLTLLGCFYGYRKFYDVFYENPSLPIFRRQVDIPIPIELVLKEERGMVDDKPSEPNLQIVEQPNAGESTLKPTSEQLPLFPTPLESEQQKGGSKQKTKSTNDKSEKEFLDELANKLALPEHETGFSLSKIAKDMKKSTPDCEQIFMTDPRFSVSTGKNKKVTLNKNGKDQNQQPSLVEPWPYP